MWGTGVTLAQEDCLNSDRWITPGIIGKLLEQIRMEFSNQFSYVSAPPSLTGVRSDPVSSHIMTDSSSTHHCEPNSHLLLGVHTEPVISPVPNTNPSELRPTMFASLSSSLCVSGMSMEISSPHAEPSEGQEEQLMLDPTSIDQPIENS